MAVLSGGAGITRAALIKRALLRIGDQPFEWQHSNSLTASATSLTLWGGVTASKAFHLGGWVAWLDDESLDQAVIDSITDPSTIGVRRGYRGATAASHAANAVFRYMGRVDLVNASQMVDEVIESLWPEVYAVTDTTFAIATPPAVWYNLPADAQKVMGLYVKPANATPTSILKWVKPPQNAEFFDTTLVASGKALFVPNVPTAGSTSDNNLHLIYAAKSALTNLSQAQIDVCTYELCWRMLLSQFASESKPERRSGLEGAPDAGEAFRFFKAAAEETRQKEAKRLAEFLPQLDHVNYRASLHYE